jgi:hypothetical protein
MRNIVGQAIVPDPRDPTILWGVIVVPKSSLVSGDYDRFLRESGELNLPQSFGFSAG